MKKQQKPKLDADKLYEEVKKQLYKLAWRCHQTYGVSFEDAMDECNYAFIKAINWRYDPAKGTKFSTCVQNIAQFRLQTLIIKRATDKRQFVPVEDEMLGAAPAATSPSLEALEDVSSDAKEILSLLLHTPREVLDLCPMPPKQLMGRLKQYLIIRCKRNPKKVEQAHREIQTRLREVWA